MKDSELKIGYSRHVVTSIVAYLAQSLNNDKVNVRVKYLMVMWTKSVLVYMSIKLHPRRSCTSWNPRLKNYPRILDKTIKIFEKVKIRNEKFEFIRITMYSLHKIRKIPVLGSQADSDHFWATKNRSKLIYFGHVTEWRTLSETTRGQSQCGFKNV